MIDYIKAQLANTPQDLEYKQFRERLACSALPVLGIRTGVLRAIARKLSADISLDNLLQQAPETYDELTVMGLIIAYKKCDITKKIAYIDKFLCYVDNWATNDIVVSTIKVKSPQYFEFALGLLNGDTWHARFGVTALMTNFLDEQHIDIVLDKLLSVKCHEYYVNMAIAWLLSVAYIKFKGKVTQFLLDFKSDTVFAMTVGKIRDSRRVSGEDKQYIKDIFNRTNAKR